MPHTLHKNRRVQQNNPEGNKCREMTLQQLSPDKKGQRFNETGEVAKDKSKQQKESIHTN